MKTRYIRHATRIYWTTFFSFLVCIIAAPVIGQDLCTTDVAHPAKISFPDLGAAVQKQYAGDGLSVEAYGGGARLHCLFQRLDGVATPEGLWLASTAESQQAARFCMKASSLGRGTLCASTLPPRGEIKICAGLVSWIRPGLTEEYSSSVDGIRQDFIILEKPSSQSPSGVSDGQASAEVRLMLSLTGGRAEAASGGATVILDGSGRRLSYSRLKVLDATNRELCGRIEVANTNCLTIIVDDANAVYPIRVDPTFSDANWMSMGVASLQLSASAMLLVTNTPTMTLYVGGGFVATNAAGVVLRNVAKWDGTTWSAVGTEINNGYVNALVIGADNNLYAGGSFTFTTAGGVIAKNIAKWDGHSWNYLGSGVNSVVNTLVVDTYGQLYAGAGLYYGSRTDGSFTMWDGNKWNSTGYSGPPVSCSLIDKQGFVVIGTLGGLVSTDPVAYHASSVKKWDGFAWTVLTSFDSEVGYADVHALAIDSQNNLYIGGDWPINIVKLSGPVLVPTSCQEINVTLAGGNYLNAVLGLTIDSADDLFISGSFSGQTPQSVLHIMKWDGVVWRTLDMRSASNEGIHDVTAWGPMITDASGNLYVAGSVTRGNYQAYNGVLRCDGSSWRDLGTGIDGVVDAMVFDKEGNLYVGGNIQSAGGLIVNNIARWDGSAWSALGRGLNGEAMAIALDGSGNLYAGGSFTMANYNPANHIAKWDGSTWTALGAGFNSDVWTLTCDVTGKIYAGGGFTTADSKSIRYVASWDGNTWSPLGIGPNGIVSALLLDSSSNLYVGGLFTIAGAVPAQNVAKWNGTSWSALGAGRGDGIVWAFAQDSSGKLYVGGGFSNNVACWNGQTWSSLGAGIQGQYSNGNNPVVRALVIDRFGYLYAGGTFDVAGGTPVNGIAKWDGQSWSSLGSGIRGRWWNYSGSVIRGGNCTSLALDSSNDLYVGGIFFSAGTNAASCVAKATLPRQPMLSLLGTNSGAILSGKAASPNSGTDFSSRAVPCGQTCTNMFTVRNDGNQTLTISCSTIIGLGASAFQVSGMPAILPPSASSSFSVAFSPTAAQGYVCTVVIACDDPKSPFLLNLAGTGARAAQNIAFPVIPDQIVTNSVVLNAVASSGFGITFRVASGPGRITGGTGLSFTNIGFVSVAASQAGDSNWLPAPSVTNTFRVWPTSLLVYATNGNELTIVGAYPGLNGTVVIPDEVNGLPVTAIGSGAFQYCTGVTNLTFPATITNIGDYAFGNCTNLWAVYFVGNPPSVGVGTFYGGSETVYYTTDAIGWDSTFVGLPTVGGAWLTVVCSNGGYVQTREGWYGVGSNAVLTVHPLANWNFDGWVGDTNECQVDGLSLIAPMTQNRRIVAALTPPVTLVVTSSYQGDWPGTFATNWGTIVNEWITNSPDIIGGTQQVCLGATVVGNDYTQISPTNVTLTLTNNATLTWIWQAQQYLLTTATNGPGSVTSGDWYYSGSNAVLVATPGMNAHQTGWSGDTNGCLIAGNTLTAPMTQTRSITALFAADTKTLTVSSDHGGAAPGSTTVNWGTLVGEWIFNATVVNGTTQYVCTGASVVGNDFTQINPTNVTLGLTNDAALTWSWTTNYYLATGTNGAGAVSVLSGWQASGTNVLLTATPMSTSHFVQWAGTTSGCVAAFTSLTVPMTQARRITAVFAAGATPVISGRVTQSGTATGLPGVTVTFSGVSNGVVLTDGNGNYSMTVPYKWSGTATASFTNGGFGTPVITYSFLTSIQSGKNYVWTPPPTISGKVTKSSTAFGVAGATITFSGLTNGVVITDGVGNYRMIVPYKWHGTAAASCTNGGFATPTITYSTALTANQTAKNYTWIPPPVISGKVTKSGTSTGVAGVTITFSGGAGTAITASNGTYSSIVPYKWSGTATATSTNGGFATPTITYTTALTANQTSKNYTWTPPPVISGKITKSGTSTGVSNVTLSASNGGGATQTGTTGSYALTVPYNWTGMVTLVSGSGGSFSPVNKSFTTKVTANQTLNFTWTAPVGAIKVQAASDNASITMTNGFAQWAAVHGLVGKPDDLFDQIASANGITYGDQYVFGANLTPGEPVMRLLSINGVPTAEAPQQDPSTLIDATVMVEFTPQEGSSFWFPTVCLPPQAATPTTKQWFQSGYGEAADFRVTVRLLR